MIEINIPAKEYVKLLKNMDTMDTGYEAADLMHKRLQAYMSEGSFEEYVIESYGKTKQ